MIPVKEIILLLGVLAVHDGLQPETDPQVVGIGLKSKMSTLMRVAKSIADMGNLDKELPTGAPSGRKMNRIRAPLVGKKPRQLRQASNDHIRN